MRVLAQSCACRPDLCIQIFIQISIQHHVFLLPCQASRALVVINDHVAFELNLLAGCEIDRAADIRIAGCTVLDLAADDLQVAV